MNAGFRSHIMENFLAQARNQSRPPLALLGLFSDDEQRNLYIPQQMASQPRQPRYVETNLSSIQSSVRTQSNVRRRHTDSEIFRSSRTSNSLANQASSLDLSSVKVDPAHQDPDSLVSSASGRIELSREFQNMLQTRKPSKRFVPFNGLPPMYESEQDYFIDALERAVKCGQATTRTDPFTFKRLIAPSQATERLAEIAYQVDLRHKQPGKSTKSAERKRDKYSQIPAFLVTTVSEDSLDTDLESVSDEYDLLPYTPPSEEALDDYAKTCAAVQNVLLSLRSENINAKWTNGPLLRTPAFRKLIRAESNDRVVGLILVGDASKKS